MKVHKKNMSPLFFRKPFYLLSLVFNSCLAITSLVLITNSTSLIVNGTGVILFILMAIEALVRPKLFENEKALTCRYKWHIGTGFVSMYTMLFLWDVDFTVLLVPFLFYRVYRDMIRALDSKVLMVMGSLSLATGVFGVPVHGFGGATVIMPVYFAWMAALSSVVLSMVWEYYSEGYAEYTTNQKVTQKISTLRTFNETLHGTLRSASLVKVYEAMATLNCGIPKERCQWHNGAKAKLEDLAHIYCADPSEAIDLNLVVTYVKDQFPDVSINLVGWRTHIHSMDMNVLLTIIHYLVKLTRQTYRINNLDNPELWITSLPEYISISDVSGGISRESLAQDDALFIENIESDEFQSFYGIDILVNTNMYRGVGNSGIQTILKAC